MILIFTHSDVFNFHLVSINTHKSKLSSLLTHPRIFFISQKPLLTLWLKGRHAMLVVTLFFSVTSGVTYGTLCQASGHLVIYHECYEFERASFTLKFFFLPCTPSCFFKAFLRPAVQPEAHQGFMFIFGTKPRPTAIIAAHKRFIFGRFYLRATAGQSERISFTKY